MTLGAGGTGEIVRLAVSGVKDVQEHRNGTRKLDSHRAGQTSVYSFWDTRISAWLRCERIVGNQILEDPSF